MKKLLFIIVLLAALISGCRFSYSPLPEDALTDDSVIGLDFAKEILDLLSSENQDSLIAIFNPGVQKRVKPQQIQWLFDNGKPILETYIYPHDSSILVSKSLNVSTSGKQIIEMFSFPFQKPGFPDSLKYFHITVSENQLYRFLISDYAPGIRFVEPKETIPHFEKLNMQTDNISWFRIWYDDGSKLEKRYGLHKGYYAVSGGSGKLEKIGARVLFQEVFNHVNNGVLDSLDIKYMEDPEIGDPEYIRLRLRFSDDEYKDKGEFEVWVYLDEEEGKKEELSDFIIVKHSEKTRYLLTKKDNPDLLNALSAIAHFDYGGHYEKAP